MLKNPTIYAMQPGDGLHTRLAQTWLEQRLQAYAFKPCGATQDKATGWIPPRGEKHGALVELVGTELVLAMQIETKAVPTAAIKKHADAAADVIEQQTGRKPGKKERKALKEDALLALLPQAFSKLAKVWIWIDRGRERVVIDASSTGQLDEAITLLVRSIDGLALQQILTTITPVMAMVQWLMDQDGPAGDFDIGRSLELKAQDEEKAAVRFTRHNLRTDEVRNHITEGKLPARLAVSWLDRATFTLLPSLQLRGVEFLEPTNVSDGTGQAAADAFDADVILSTGQLGPMIDALIAELGGLFQPTTGAAA